ncbi:MAG: peptidylprolyl isomerase [Clostridioides sp.]|jgi:peptidyl-prolyl cis-trans isomerase C|nr:peptidylprolyl isomerase [Clostridioides sp.]
MESKILATVGAKNITNIDIEDALRTMNQYQLMQYNTEDGKKQLLEDLINQELFYLEAIETGMDKEEAFLSDLEKVKANLLKQVAISKVLAAITITDDEKRAFYEANKEAFNKPESATAKHILVDSEDKAIEVLARINSGEISFEDAAKEVSTCPSSAQGGDLGNFSRGQMVPEFEEKVFNMKPGEVSEPVQTQFGYHVIKLDTLEPSQVAVFEEVQEEIEKNLMYQKQNQAYTDKLNNLKAQYGSQVSYIEE